MKNLYTMIIIVALTLFAVPALAQESNVEKEAHAASTNSFVVAPHVGVGIPQLFGELGSWPIFGLEVGYIMPFDVGSMKRPLQASLALHYSAPGASGKGQEGALGESGAAYSWELEQRLLMLDVPLMWRFMEPGSFLSVYATLGPRFYFMESIMTATGNGGDFGENRETNFEIGGFLGAGADFALGPGTLFGALIFSYSDLQERITGDANTGTLSLDFGYRLYLF